jgi:methionyl aminopeptidase
MTKLENILEILSYAVAPGVTTKKLDELAGSTCRTFGVEPAFKGYKPPNFGGPEGYPAHICVSIDNEVIHGIPSDRKIEEGQVVKLDLGTLEDGQYDDGATTILVGNCSSAARRLVKGTKEALDAGVSAAISGNTTHDIAKAISAVAEQYDLHVIHGYGGHGIGEKLHMEPHIPNEIDGSPAIPLVAGMRIAIEPMFATNHGNTYVDKDGWTIKLHGGGLAAHFEKTVTIN